MGHRVLVSRVLVGEGDPGFLGQVADGAVNVALVADAIAAVGDPSTQEPDERLVGGVRPQVVEPADVPYQIAPAL